MTPTIWTERQLVARSDHDRLWVYDRDGQAIATMADADFVLRDVQGRPQLTLHAVVPRSGTTAFTAAHPEGGRYGNIGLDRRVFKSIRLHLFDPAGGRVAGLRTLDRRGWEAVVEDNGGRLLARTGRRTESGRVAEEQVDLDPGLEGGLHALVLIAALRVPRWQRFEWSELNFSPTTF